MRSSVPFWCKRKLLEEVCGGIKQHLNPLKVTVSTYFVTYNNNKKEILKIPFKRAILHGINLNFHN